MRLKELRRDNIRYYHRYYKLLSLAVLIMVAVIIGSLAIGDSVRNTLIKRVGERLGTTETIIFSKEGYLNKDLLQNPLFKKKAEGVLLSDGFLSFYGKLIPVTVWGLEDQNIPKGGAKINRQLAKELESDPGKELVLRLPSAGLVPSGSLFVTDQYTASLRLNNAGIKEVQEGGNRNLKNEQSLPLNIFVNREELASILEIEGKINLILSPEFIKQEAFDTAWSFSESGLKTYTCNDVTEITLDRIFLPQLLVQTLCNQNPKPNRLFSYLVNTLAKKENEIPYSFVTAIDRFQGEELLEDEIILSDYAAKQLRANKGDWIRLDFFTSGDLKTLSIDTLRVKVSRIVPLKAFQSDSTLSADFPGLSNVESCSDWNSDLPINMKRITKQDEQYWNAYRNTPKALISYSAVSDKWSNAFGSVTALRIDSSSVNLENITPAMMGVQLFYPKEAGLIAALNGVDFSSLFLALGFFIILSALLLMLVPLSEMIYQRKQEWLLLRSAGYTKKRMIQLLWAESSPLVLISSIAGVGLGLLYTYGIMGLLGSLWKGATHTEGFGVYPNLMNILIGLLVGIGLALLVLRIYIVRTIRPSKIRVPVKVHTRERKVGILIVGTVLIMMTFLINEVLIKSNALMIFVGIKVIATIALWGEYFVYRKGTSIKRGLQVWKIRWASIFAGKKQAVLSFVTLSMGIFIVFMVGLNRKGFSDSSQLRSGTGGYTFWCESSVPVYHNMTSDEGKEKLGLKDLPSDAQILQICKYEADDASCLNLNKVNTPSVLGIDMDLLKQSEFDLGLSLFSENKEQLFEKMKTKSDSLYPVWVDETVLIWGLGMQLGDTLYYENSKGEKVYLQLVGALKNSVFQGNIIMDKSLFSEVWADQVGSNVILVKVADNEQDKTKTILSQALSNYGLRIMTTADRLKEFYSVSDTYLTIFMTLGGMGLIIGIMAFVIIIRKNLTSRKKEIVLYQSLGFTDKRIGNLLFVENLIVPFLAIIIGFLSAILGVSSGIHNISNWIWLLAGLLCFFFMACAFVFIRLSVKKVIISSKV